MNKMAPILVSMHMGLGVSLAQSTTEAQSIVANGGMIQVTKVEKEQILKARLGGTLMLYPH